MKNQLASTKHGETGQDPSCDYPVGEQLFDLQCPVCSQALLVRQGLGQCASRQHSFEKREGIWRFLQSDQVAGIDSFLSDYRLVRSSEGWGSTSTVYYRNLPFVPPDDPQRAIWRVRAKNYRRLIARLANATRFRILDAGAGNGWLSFQLSRRGHIVAAVDLSDDPRDGLGARVHYDATFECYQATFDRMPFREAQFNLVVFNSSLHYAVDLAATLKEASRILSPRGKIVVLDSPFYQNPDAGQAMVAARERGFAEKYGLHREVRAIGFLTLLQLAQAAAVAGLRCETLDDGSSLRGELRRTWTQWRSGREPARFPFVVLQK